MTENTELKQIQFTLESIRRDDLSYSQKCDLIYECFSRINYAMPEMDKLGYSIKDMIYEIEERQRALVN